MKRIFTFLGLMVMIHLAVAQEMAPIHQKGHGFQISNTTTRESEDAMIDASEIEYWVGNGSNEVVFAVNWCEPAMALAWGVRFEDFATVEDIMDTIVKYDSRFSYYGASGFMMDIDYTDENYTLTLVGEWWMYNINGISAPEGYTTQEVVDGDLIKWGDESCGTTDESWNYTWTTPITPVSSPDAPSEEFVTPFPTDDITFWVGEGENEATVILYWCQDIAAGLAYGYRWNGEATVGNMLSAIDAADTRLSINGDAWINSYSFNDANYNMHLLTEGWLVYSINGDWDAMINMTDPISNGDVFQMKDYQCDMSDHIFPVSDINAPDTLFDGMVGTPGCQAIYFEDEAIKGWATACTLERGWQDIANPVATSSFGDENYAIGASSENTMECVSLGDGGSATLTFDIPVQNGDGYDFAVFENSLNGYFLELAFVEVSSDGEHFVRFPASSNTQTVNQIVNADSVKAENINNLAGKYLIGWGTPFDLEELAGIENLNINNITHVRIVDVVGSVNPLFATRDRYGRIINDPYPTDFPSCGFDLSGVAVLNGWKPSGINTHANAQLMVYPNPCTDVVRVATERNQVVELYNINGQLLNSVESNDGLTTINMQNFPAGVYMLKVGNSVQKILKK